MNVAQLRDYLNENPYLRRACDVSGALWSIDERGRLWSGHEQINDEGASGWAPFFRLASPDLDELSGSLPEGVYHWETAMVLGTLHYTTVVGALRHNVHTATAEFLKQQYRPDFDFIEDVIAKHFPRVIYFFKRYYLNVYKHYDSGDVIVTESEALDIVRSFLPYAMR